MSPANPRVKNLVRLREARHRRRQGRFLVEGARELARALASGWALETVFFCPELFGDEAAFALLESVDRAGVEAVQLAEPAFAKAAYRENPDGWLGVAEIPERRLEDLRLFPEPLLLVAEGVEKPGNLGALLRSADAAGVDAVIAADAGGDLYNPNAIRASQGAFFACPWVTARTAEVQAWLSTAQPEARVVALTPDAEPMLWEVDLRGALVLAVGAEDTGLTAAWLEAPEMVQARLPMRGVTDSLNVSVAAGVALFEAVRQRQTGSP